MCLSEYDDMYKGCDDYQANYLWMKSSGNACWGMGAARYVPCLNCGLEEWRHRNTDDDTI